jgi:hypothetical protein
MKGRWMLDFASSDVWSRSTSFFRDITCDDLVPAENLRMNSFNCSIFFSRCALPLSMLDRIWVFARTISS